MSLAERCDRIVELIDNTLGPGDEPSAADLGRQLPGRSDQRGG